VTLGTLRRRGTLEAVLTRFLKHPDRPIPPAVRQILYAAIYQMIFLERVPAFAVVNEAVEQTGRYHQRARRGMVNAVLRNLGRSLSAPIGGRPPEDAHVVPLGPGRYRRFDTPVLPDPQRRPGDWFAACCSLPAALARRWRKRAGSVAKALALGHHANARPPLIARVNARKATVAEAIEALRADGVNSRPHANGVSVVLESAGDVAALAALRAGLIQPQDPTPTAVVAAAPVRPGMRVLDFCAAPGTKTTHLAERMDNQGEIVALDISAEKLGRIEDNCRRMGIDIVTTRLADELGSLQPRSFDLVLADVPCTNTGVLARRPEARWRFDETRLAKVVRDQRLLARAAAEFTRFGGTLIYSTCSIEPEECARVARSVEKQVSHLKLTAEKLTWPAGGAEDPTVWHDGGYYAILS